MFILNLQEEVVGQLGRERMTILSSLVGTSTS
jgi:hypothetical protein